MLSPGGHRLAVEGLFILEGSSQPLRKEMSLSLPPETEHLPHTAWDSTNLINPQDF